jgi:hypothetical protein
LINRSTVTRHAALTFSTASRQDQGIKMINTPLVSPRNVGAAGLVRDAESTRNGRPWTGPHRRARTDGVPDLALERLRQEPNLDLALQFDLNPCEELQALLATSAFNSALRDATTHIEALVRQGGSPNPTLSKALELLAEGTALRREVAAQRNALRQG